MPELNERLPEEHPNERREKSYYGEPLYPEKEEHLSEEYQSAEYDPDSRLTESISFSGDVDYQAYQILRFAFIALPLVAGIDKFADYFADWDLYLAPIVPRTLGILPHSFMMGVGVIEIIAAIGIILRPRIFSYVVGAWFAAVIVNLVLTGTYYDIMLRDFGLCLGAFAFARLASRFDPSEIEVYPVKPMLH